MGTNRVILNLGKYDIATVVGRVDAILVPPRLVRWATDSTIRTKVGVITRVCSRDDKAEVKASAALEATLDGASEVVIPMAYTENMDILTNELQIISSVRKGPIWFDMELYLPLSKMAACFEAVPNGCGLWVTNSVEAQLASLLSLPFVFDAGNGPVTEDFNSVCTAVLPDKATRDDIYVTATEF